VTTLAADLARRMEPRRGDADAAAWKPLRRLNQAGVPTTVMVAPVSRAQ